MVTTELKPFLKWSGSKHWIANAIQCQFPIRFSRYYEPLVGGGSVFLSLQRQSDRWEGIGDANSWLTDTYRAIRDSYDRVISILESLAPCKTVYDRVKSIHPDGLVPEYRAANLIYLNQLCFGHTFRVDRRGYFGGSFADIGLDSVYNVDHLYQIHQRLQDVYIHTGDFTELASQAEAGDFVYFDPPEMGNNVFGPYGSSHRAYKEDRSCYRFRDNDYYRLSLLCHDLDTRGVLWAISDANTPLMRILLSKYHRTTISIDKSSQEIKSILFTNYTTLDSNKMGAVDASGINVTLSGCD